MVCLKKAESMSVAELSRLVEITPMAVRQHLVALERKGIVDYTTRRYGIGRPVYQYRLTEKAEGVFPKSYGEFISSMLKNLETVDGKGKVDELFRLRKEQLFSEKKEHLKTCKSFSEKVSALAEGLEAEGYMVELEYADGAFNLKQFNCPIADVTAEFAEPCKYELQLYRELLRLDVHRTTWRKEGAPSCSYTINLPD